MCYDVGTVPAEKVNDILAADALAHLVLAKGIRPDTLTELLGDALPRSDLSCHDTDTLDLIQRAYEPVLTLLVLEAAVLPHLTHLGCHALGAPLLHVADDDGLASLLGVKQVREARVELRRRQLGASGQGAEKGEEA